MPKKVEIKDTKLMVRIQTHTISLEDMLRALKSKRREAARIKAELETLAKAIEYSFNERKIKTYTLGKNLYRLKGMSRTNVNMDILKSTYKEVYDACSYYSAYSQILIEKIKEKGDK